MMMPSSSQSGGNQSSRSEVNNGRRNLVRLPYLMNPEYTLRSYQHEGLHWLASMCVRRLNGILADEMGLGKTITMLGTMYVNPLPYTLIVVPVALIEQWRKVITQYLNIEPIIYHSQNKSPLTIEESLSNNKLI